MLRVKKNSTIFLINFVYIIMNSFNKKFSQITRIRTDVMNTETQKSQNFTNLHRSGQLLLSFVYFVFSFDPRALKFLSLSTVQQKFGMTPKQFGENLSMQNFIHHPIECPKLPEECAVDYICSDFPSIDSVLKGFVSFCSQRQHLSFF